MAGFCDQDVAQSSSQVPGLPHVYSPCLMCLSRRSPQHAQTFLRGVPWRQTGEIFRCTSRSQESVISGQPDARAVNFFCTGADRSHHQLCSCRGVLPSLRLQIHGLHVARPQHSTPQQSISDTSSRDVATDIVRRRAKTVLDRHDSTQAGQAGTVACSVVKHERLKLLVNL